MIYGPGEYQHDGTQSLNNPPDVCIAAVPTFSNFILAPSGAQEMLTNVCPSVHPIVLLFGSNLSWVLNLFFYFSFLLGLCALFVGQTQPKILCLVSEDIEAPTCG